jgi:probable FeS assembly SUF system protein SufT
MSDEGFIPLSRDIEATRIPSGESVLLTAETPVLITQALGGSYTVHVGHQSGLFRIKGSDADALGKEPLPTEAAASTDGPFEEEKAWAQLRNCYDPEIPVNIVDLGLIYSLEATDAPDGKGKNLEVKMTLTAPGCGMGPSLAADAEQRLLTVPGVAGASVLLVWDPPWSPALISPAGKEKLGMV